MTVLAALCDIFGCTPGDLITIQPVAVPWPDTGPSAARAGPHPAP